MARSAGIESQSSEFHGLARRFRFVAFFAGDSGVHPGKWVACFRMVELRGLFPVACVVALFAGTAKLPLMRIGVASQALL